jgi:tetratricopeptide (TPR) repeat protein
MAIAGKINTETEFMEYVDELLTFRGFNIHFFPKTESTGADGGRDFEGTTFEYEPAYGYKIEVKWWGELKYRGKKNNGSLYNLGVDDLNNIAGKIRRCTSPKFLLVTNVRLTEDLRRRLEEIAAEEKVALRIWDLDALERIEKKRDEQETGENKTYMGQVGIADRENERKDISNIISIEKKNALLLHGVRGVGKSVLAKHMAHSFRVSDKYGYGCIDCREPIQMGLRVKALAYTLKMQGFVSCFTNSVDMKKDESERIIDLCNHMEKHKTMIILDNFEEVFTGGENFEITSSPMKKLLEYVLNHQTEGVLLITSQKSLYHIYGTATRYEELEIRGWEMTFFINSHMENLKNLNRKIKASQKNYSEIEVLLEPLQGNPYALNILNLMCEDNSFNPDEALAKIAKKGDAAQYLLREFAVNIPQSQIIALNKMAQFSRPINKDEVEKFICESETFENLIYKKLIEVTTNGRKSREYNLHSITIQQFNLANNIEKRKTIVKELIAVIEREIGDTNVNELSPHLLKRQVIDMLISVGEFECAAEHTIEIGTRIISSGDIDYISTLISKLYNSDISKVNRTRLMKTEAHIESNYGRLSEAESIYTKMLIASNEIKDAWSKSAALNGIGSWERYNCRWKKALCIYKESLAIREANDMHFETSNSHHNIGAVYIGMGKFDKAIYHLEKSYKIRLKYNDEFRSSASQMYLAEAYASLGEFEKAGKLLEKCIKIKSKLNDVIGHTWACLMQAKMFVLSDNHEQLQNHESELEKVKKQAIETEPRHIPLVNIFLGIAAFSQGGKDNYRKALNLFNETLSDESPTIQEVYESARDRLSTIASKAARTPESNTGDNYTHNWNTIKTIITFLKI